MNFIAHSRPTTSPALVDARNSSLRGRCLRWHLIIAVGVSLVGGTMAAAEQRFARSEQHMGTTVQVLLYAKSAEQARHAMDAAFDRVENLETLLSDYRAGSEVNRLSKSSGERPPGPAMAVSDDLWTVLQFGVKVAQQSRGAFDVTAGPLTRLWRRSRQLGSLPTSQRLVKTRKSVGFDKLRLHPETRSVSLLAPHMHIDLGGIAKGYILDQMMRVLENSGIERALINGGGDVVAGGPPPGQGGWTVAVPSAEPEGGRAAVQLVDAALATSGNTYRYVEIDGVRYSHIVDPASGLGLTHGLVVSVYARDGMTADALASAVSVLGVSDGIALMEAFPPAAVRIVDPDSDPAAVHTSAGFPPTR